MSIKNVKKKCRWKKGKREIEDEGRKDECVKRNEGGTKGEERERDKNLTFWPNYHFALRGI